MNESSFISFATEAWCKLSPWFEWGSLKNFGNSAFTTSLLGALAGAYAGAYAAQKIAENAKVREEISKQIRDTNAGIVVAFTIVNALLALKKQHVASLKATHDSELTRFKEYSTKRQTGQIQGNAPYHLQIDFRTFPVSVPPMAILQEIVFSKLSVSSRPLSLVASLVEVLSNLNAAISRRNDLIETFKEGKYPDGADIVSIYLGLPYNGGHVNKEYGDIVSAIYSYTNDAIFFSHLLCQDLQAHGLEVIEKNKNLLKNASLQVSEVDFTKAGSEKLLPSSDEYGTWFTAFVEHPKPNRRWWQRIAERIHK